MIDHHTAAMAMSIQIESTPDMLFQIADAITRAKDERRGRPKKGAQSQSITDEITIYNEDQNPPDSWKQIAAELNKNRSLSQNPDWMAQPDSGWHNFPEVNQGDTGFNNPQYDSENEASLSPAIRVDRTNHDKNLSSAGTIQFMPKKGSIQRPRAKSQKVLPIYEKDALAHTFANASMDVDEIPEQLPMNSQD
jgi:hypothetical protein